MESSDLDKLIQSGEGTRTEFKESLFLKDSGKIAKNLVSFANRYGGIILVGIKDDGTIEGATINKSKESLTVLNIANNNCSPAVEVDFDYVNSANGDIFLIIIHRRRGSPHAIVDRPGAEILRRIYYMRIGNGNRLVDDNKLTFMFHHTDDPYQSLTTSLCVWYNRSPFDLSPIKSLNYISAFVPFLQELRDENAAFLYSDYIENIQKLIVEVFPYAFLIELSRHFSLSWITEISKTESIGETITTRALRVDLPFEWINVEFVNFDALDILPRLSIDAKDILSRYMTGFKLPKDTKVTIERKLKDFVSQSILRLSNPFFNVSIDLSSQRWSAGLPSIVRNFVVRDQTKIQDDFATCIFTLKFEGLFKSPDVFDPFFDEHYQFVHEIYDLIESGWNWDKELKKLKESQIHLVNRNVMKILDHLERER